jgi:SET domain-containing protein
MLYRSNKIYLDESGIHGRGVFASEFIKSGEILEECHFIVLPNDVAYPTILNEYLFSWPKGESGLAVCLGFGSIFNHSDTEFNANWETDTTKKKFIFFSTRDINIGEEIFLNYQR